MFVSFLINGFITDIFQSLRNSPEVSDLLTMSVIIGIIISRLNLIKWVGKGSLLQYIVLVFIATECTSSCVISIKMCNSHWRSLFRGSYSGCMTRFVPILLILLSKKSMNLLGKSSFFSGVMLHLIFPVGELS